MKEYVQTNQENEPKENPYRIHYDNYMDTTSSDTECTGLIPAGGIDGQEWERYKDIFPFGGQE